MPRRGTGPFRFMRRHQGDPAEVPPALQRAHHLMAEGNYAEAATIFEQLGSLAENRQGARAPFMFLQAGRARMMLRQTSQAVGHIRHGLEILAATGRYNQFYRAGTRTIQELQARGFHDEAAEIASIIQKNTPAIANITTERGPDPSKTLLPTHCPSCGGPVRPDEVEWLDIQTAACPYCGSPVRG